MTPSSKKKPVRQLKKKTAKVERVLKSKTKKVDKKYPKGDLKMKTRKIK